MKKLALFCGIAALGMFAMNAGAVIPAGYEPVNFTATLTVYNGENNYKTVTANNKDLLNLINNQFGTVPSSGAQLVTRGVGDDGSSFEDSAYFSVLYQDGAVAISDASSDTGDYELYFEPYTDGIIYKETSSATDTWNYEMDQSELYYQDYSDANYFYMYGLTTDTINFDNDNENFSMSNAEGYFDMPIISTGDDYGIITGKLSGSASHVEDPWDY